MKINNQKRYEDRIEAARNLKSAGNLRGSALLCPDPERHLNLGVSLAAGLEPDKPSLKLQEPGS